MDEQEIEARASLSSVQLPSSFTNLCEGLRKLLDCYPSDKRLSDLGVTDALSFGIEAICTVYHVTMIHTKN